MESALALVLTFTLAGAGSVGAFAQRKTARPGTAAPYLASETSSSPDAGTSSDAAAASSSSSDANTSSSPAASAVSSSGPDANTPSSPTVSASAATKHALAYADSPVDNPLKGFATLGGNGGDWPASLEYYQIPWNKIVTGENSFDWSYLEGLLDDTASRGRTSILMFYMDWPGSGENDIPQFLLDEGLKTHAYTSYGGGKCPDYKDPRLWKTIFNFIAALGKKYDGDPRIAHIDTSIVGYWGEQHTYPDTQYGPTDSQLLQLAQAYDKAFSVTQLSMRSPRSGMSQLNLGYDDFSFADETYNEDWSHYSYLKEYNAVNAWQKSMIGGELYPDIQNTIFAGSNWIGGNNEDYKKCVSLLHPSFLLDAQSAWSYSGTMAENAEKAARMLGYDFYATSASFKDTLSSGAKQSLSVSIKNIGVAPFYYPWKMEVGVFQDGGQVAAYKTSWNIKSIVADGQNHTFSFNDIKALPAGSYTLAIRVVNPLEGGLPLRFANETQQDDGWLNLGTFTQG